MNQLALLRDALNYIENNLTNDLKTEDISAFCYCSKSTLEKLFRCVNGITVRDYIIRRRMMKAARFIHNNPKCNLLDVALQIGYGSNEAFTRAFEQVWHCKPSEFRGKAKYSELYPRLLSPLEIGDDYMKTRRPTDISELYDLFVERKNCYFVCCDIKNLMSINDISIKAGDLAILESMNRMNKFAGEDDMVFRIGADEFALLTNSEDISYANIIAEKISAMNNETFTYENQEIPLYLYVSIVKLEYDEALHYSDLFTSLHTNLIKCK